MYARSMSGRERWTYVESMIPFVRSMMRPEITAIPGNLGLCLLLDQRGRRYVVISGWESRDAMKASEQAVAPLRADATRAFDGAPVVAEWEVASFHVHGALEPGMWVSVSCGTAEPATLDSIVEAFDSTAVTAVREMRNCPGALLLVNREDGRVATAAVFDTYRALHAARAGRARLHDLAASGVAADPDGLREYELDVAEMEFPDSV